MHVFTLFVATVLFFSFQCWAFACARRWANQFRVETAKVPSHFLTYTHEEMPSWFASFAQTLKTPVHINHAREVALQQVEEHIHSQAQYQALQKATVAAPLLGVILTAFGFITFDGELDTVRTLAFPLVSGVLCGALLAIINVILLYLIESDLEDARCCGQALIDDCWVQSINDAGDPNQQFIIAAQSLNTTLESFQTLIGQFPKDVSGFTQRFDSVATIAESTFEHLERISPQLQTLVDTWKTSTAEIAASTDKHLLPALASLREGTIHLEETGKSLDKTVNSFNVLAENFEGTSTDQQQILSDLIHSTQAAVNHQEANLSTHLESMEAFQREVFNKLTGSIEGTVTEFSGNIHEQFEQIKEGTDGISVPLMKAGDALSAAAPALENTGHILELITQSTVRFSDVIDRDYVPAFEQVHKFETLAEKITLAVDRLTTCLKSADELDKSHEALTRLIKQRALPTAEVLQRATCIFEDSASEMSESSKELGHAVRHLRRKLSRDETNITGYEDPDIPF